MILSFFTKVNILHYNNLYRSLESQDNNTDVSQNNNQVDQS